MNNKVSMFSMRQPRGCLFVMMYTLLALVLTGILTTYLVMSLNPVRVPASTISGDESLELQILHERVEFALVSVDRILSILEVFGVITAVAGGLAAVVGYVRLSDIGQEIDKVRRLNEQISRDRQSIEEVRNEVKHLLQILEEERQELTERSGTTARALALTQLAQEQITLGNFRTAYESLKRACDIDPDNRVIRYFMGDVCLRLDNAEEGIEHLSKAIEGGDFPDALASYGYALRLLIERGKEDVKRYTEVEKIFKRLHVDYDDLLDISGESVYGALAGLYKRLGKTREAIHWYTEITKVTPYNTYPLSNLGTLNFRIGNFEEARKYLERIPFIHQSDLTKLKKQEAITQHYWRILDSLVAQIVLNSPVYEIQEKNDDALDLREALQIVVQYAPNIEALDKLVDDLKPLADTPYSPHNLNKYIKIIESEMEQRKRDILTG